MSIETVTLYLDPMDVAIAEYWDPSIQDRIYTFTIEKTKVPVFAKFLLDKLSSQEKANIPVNIKADIVRGSGWKYICRVPTVLRALGAGIAGGIALKTVSNHGSQALFEKLPNAARTSLSWIELHPYLSAATIATACLATTQTPQEITSFLSSVFEGTLSIAQKAIRITKRSFNEIGTFCQKHPIKILTLGATAGGVFYWEKSYPGTMRKIIAQFEKFYPPR